jgi:hypothetical protein
MGGSDPPGLAVATMPGVGAVSDTYCRSMCSAAPAKAPAGTKFGVMTSSISPLSSSAARSVVPLSTAACISCLDKDRCTTHPSDVSVSSILQLGGTGIVAFSPLVASLAHPGASWYGSVVTVAVALSGSLAARCVT